MHVNPALPARFQLQSSRLAALPVLNHFIHRWGIPLLLEKHLPPPDPRSKLLPAQVLLTLLRNLVLSHRPLYSLGEWAAEIDPGCLGLAPGQTSALNDDRVGRALDDLFDADRQALLTDLVVRLIQEFRIDLSELHNDSTSLTLFGDYPEGDGRRVRGKPSLQVTWGYNKDHRPDLKQLLWILTISADGAVPVHFKVTNGNTEDPRAASARLPPPHACSNFSITCKAIPCCRTTASYRSSRLSSHRSNFNCWSCSKSPPTPTPR
jgi:transposase